VVEHGVVIDYYGGQTLINLSESQVSHTYC